MKRSPLYYCILAAMLFVLFLANDFGFVNIQRTAIITAVGIDAEEEGVKVTAFTDVPIDTKSVNTVTVQGKGKTVAEAFADINAQTGWYPKLVFCDIILLGEDMQERDVFAALDFFLRLEYARDSSLVAIAQGRAEDILSKKSPLDSVASEVLTGVLSAEAKRAGRVVPVNLKDFAIGYFSDGKSGYMPYVTVSEKEGNAFFSAGETVLFYGGRAFGRLTEQETLCFSLVKNKIRSATISAEADGEEYSLSYQNGKGAVKVDIRDNIPYVTLCVDGKVRIRDTNQSTNLLRLTSSLIVEESVCRAVEKEIADTLTSIYATASAANCDLFGVREQLRRNHNRYYEAFADEILSRAVLQTDIRLSGEKA